MVELSTPAYLFLVFFCVYSASGFEYRRRKWLVSRSRWDVYRMVLCAACLLAVVVGLPLAGPPGAGLPIALAGMLSICIGGLESSASRSPDEQLQS